MFQVTPRVITPALLLACAGLFATPLAAQQDPTVRPDTAREEARAGARQEQQRFFTVDDLIGQTVRAAQQDKSAAGGAADATAGGRNNASTGRIVDIVMTCSNGKQTAEASGSTGKPEETPASGSGRGQPSEGAASTGRGTEGHPGQAMVLIRLQAEGTSVDDGSGTGRNQNDNARTGAQSGKDSRVVAAPLSQLHAAEDGSLQLKGAMRGFAGLQEWDQDGQSGQARDGASGREDDQGRGTGREDDQGRGTGREIAQRPDSMRDPHGQHGDMVRASQLSQARITTEDGQQVNAQNVVVDLQEGRPAYLLVTMSDSSKDENGGRDAGATIAARSRGTESSARAVPVSLVHKAHKVDDSQGEGKRRGGSQQDGDDPAGSKQDPERSAATRARTGRQMADEQVVLTIAATAATIQKAPEVDADELSKLGESEFESKIREAFPDAGNARESAGQVRRR